MSIPDGLSGQEHGSAGNTYGTIPSPHVVGMSKVGASLRQAIEVGSVDVDFTMGGNGFERHVVSKNEEEIRMCLAAV